MLVKALIHVALSISDSFFRTLNEPFCVITSSSIKTEPTTWFIGALHLELFGISLYITSPFTWQWSVLPIDKEKSVAPRLDRQQPEICAVASIDGPGFSRQAEFFM